jgi:hypothetical protein
MTGKRTRAERRKINKAHRQMITDLLLELKMWGGWDGAIQPQEA